MARLKTIPDTLAQLIDTSTHSRIEVDDKNKSVSYTERACAGAAIRIVRTVSRKTFLEMQQKELVVVDHGSSVHLCRRLTAFTFSAKGFVQHIGCITPPT